MAVAPSSRRSGPYVLSEGQTGPHDFDFPIKAAADLRVTRVRGGAETRLTLGDDYTVTGVGVAAGGTISQTVGAQAGDILVIEAEEVIERPGDAQTARLDADPDINRPGDAAARRLQDLRRDLERVARVPVTEAGVLLPSAAARSHRVAAYDAAGQPVPGPYTSFLEALFNLNSDAEDWGLVNQGVSEVIDWGSVA